jgi:hypothetical protein
MVPKHTSEAGYFTNYLTWMYTAVLPPPPGPFNVHKTSALKYDFGNKGEQGKSTKAPARPIDGPEVDDVRVDDKQEVTDPVEGESGSETASTSDDVMTSGSDVTTSEPVPVPVPAPAPKFRLCVSNSVFKNLSGSRSRARVANGEH